MNRPSLTADDFPAFFRELWGTNCSPFPWQQEFARRLCAGKAPDYVAVPTGSGKTACLDAAVFALAVQAAMPVVERTQGRRIFFIVNRRIIVDEAYERAEKLCNKLRNAPPASIAGQVAAALRKLSGKPEAAPLTHVQLRGGIPRDCNWATSLLQPMIICSTVDQAGSRLLFRGYGVSPQARPIHASLVAQDSLLIIDEAHISRPFIQTLRWVEKYRRYQPAESETVQLPFQLIQMTATPPAGTLDDQKIILSPEDREHAVLKRRLCCPKPARLVIEPKATGKNRTERDKQLANRFVEEAENILTGHNPTSLAIMVNRVSTARAIAKKLAKKDKGKVTLLTGRLRPLDREAVTKEIQERLKTDTATSPREGSPIVVVSTQCLEVGADLDFDALVTEAASLDSLRQRFGRLNRGGRDIVVQAVVILPGDQNVPANKLDDTAPCDSIYGNAIPRTWHWLNSLAQDGTVDFGINTMTAAVDILSANGSDDLLAPMLSPTIDAPVLLPAYLDCWVQTSPTPEADPDVAIFLHGPQRDTAEALVCWRADLPETFDETLWADTVSLCPPSANECLPVPLHVFRSWIGTQNQFADLSGDTEENTPPPERKDYNTPPRVAALIWRGSGKSCRITNPGDIVPGDTIVLRAQDGGWKALGYLPDAPSDPQEMSDTQLSSANIRQVDLAERAAASTRRRAVLRIHPALWPTPEAGTPAELLRDMSLDPERDWRSPEIKELLSRLLSDENPGWVLTCEQRETIKHLADRKVRLVPPEPYPDGQGFSLTSRDLLSCADSDKEEDTDADALLEAVRSQELCDHTRDVLAHLEKTIEFLPLAAWSEALIAAAMAHDWGKIDSRFQALLRGTTPFAAMACEKFFAKSGSIASSAAARRAARERAELPTGFRHEMLSVQMAQTETAKSTMPQSPVKNALALYLITTHHGYGRPFAPLVYDDVPPAVSLPLNGQILTVKEIARLDSPAHALDSGIVERFWQMNRRFGWWGIAFLETVLRLADQAASRNPQTFQQP